MRARDSRPDAEVSQSEQDLSHQSNKMTRAVTVHRRLSILTFGVAALGSLVGTPRLALGQSNNVYATTVSEYDDDIFELENGAIFEKTSYSYVGYLGYRTMALLYSRAGSVRLWVEGEGEIRGELIRGPDRRPNAHGTIVTVMQIQGDGRFLELLSGDLLEVDSVDAIMTSIWMAPFEAIVFNDGRLFRLDGLAETVRVIAVR